MLLKLKVLIVFAVCILISCSSDDVEEKTLIGRSVTGVRVQVDSLGDYTLSWIAPADLEYFEGYHFWLTNNEAYLGFDSRSEVSSDDFVTSEGEAYYSDSLGNLKLNSWMIPSDKLELLNSDSLFVFVWAEFSEGQKAGARMGTPFFKGDIFPPRDVELEFKLDTDSIVVNWLHLGDRKDLLDTSDLTGKVVGYQFYLEATSLDKVLLSSESADIKLLDSAIWEVEKPFDIKSVQRGVVLDSVNGKVKRSFFVENISAELGDSLNIKIKGLKPAELYVLSVEAIDSVGNKLPSPKSFSLLTYSSFSPNFSNKFEIDSLIGGAGYFSWNAAVKNSKNTGGFSAISHYEVFYFDSLFSPVRQTVEIFKHDTTDIQKGIVWGVFNDRDYEFFIFAVDSTGKSSDTLQLTSSSFTKASLCPEEAGLVLGDSSSFCMQRWEATQEVSRDSVIHSLPYLDAVNNCEALDDGSGLSWSLCTESQWDLSCLQGAEAKYGVIEAGLNYNDLLGGVCNLSTGNALESFSQREGRCVNSFGIFDLPGQYQEWVLDSNGIGRIRGGSWKQSKSGQDYAAAECGSRINPVLLHSPFAVIERDVVVEIFGEKLIWNDSLELIHGSLEDDSSTILVIGKEEFVDSLHILKIDELGLDTVMVSDLPVNSDQWSDVYQGLSVSLNSTIAGLKISGNSKKYNRFYRSNSLSYRCCAKVE
jgi:hypothetical protein